MLQKIVGRTDEIFVTQDGTQIEGFYFGIFMSMTSWALKYQIIQKSYTRILYKVILAQQGCKQEELDEIISKTRLVMGADCQVDFEFVDDIPKSPSGKYRYILSEVERQSVALVEEGV